GALDPPWRTMKTRGVKASASAILVSVVDDAIMEGESLRGRGILPSRIHSLGMGPHYGKGTFRGCSGPPEENKKASPTKSEQTSQISTHGPFSCSFWRRTAQSRRADGRSTPCVDTTAGLLVNL